MLLLYFCLEIILDQQQSSDAKHPNWQG